MSQNHDQRPPNLNREELLAWQRMTVDARRQLQDYDLRIQSRFEAERVWKRLLSDGERQALGDNLLRVWREMGTLGMWMQAKSYTNRFAALAALIEAISSPAWLAGQVSLAVDGASHPVDRPVWNPQTGVLSLAGKPIRRKIRRYRHPSNVQAILNAFQNAGWPDTIANPLGDTKNGVKLHQAVHQLNQTLRRIRFSALEGAKFVTWLAAKSRNSKSSQSQLE